MKKILIILLVLSLLPLLSFGAEKHSVKPKDGFVPNKETAIKIAIAVWTPIYGKEQIEKQKPYRAELIDEIWIVQGTLNQPKGKIRLGGVALAEISKIDGRIIRISHGK